MSAECRIISKEVANGGVSSSITPRRGLGKLLADVRVWQIRTDLGSPVPVSYSNITVPKLFAPFIARMGVEFTASSLSRGTRRSR